MLTLVDTDNAAHQGAKGSDKLTIGDPLVDVACELEIAVYARILIAVGFLLTAAFF